MAIPPLFFIWGTVFAIPKGVWNSAYTKHLAFLWFLETIRNCVNRASWQRNRHSSSSLSSLCQAYTPIRGGSTALLTLSGTGCPGTREKGHSGEHSGVADCGGCWVCQLGRLVLPTHCWHSLLQNYQTVSPADTCLPAPAVFLPSSSCPKHLGPEASQP